MTEVIKVLLVEDDEDDYFLTSDYLEQCESPSFELTWVTNSLDAVEALKADSFELCLLDYLLGAENAIDVLGVLKSNQFSLPVVILTGQSDQIDAPPTAWGDAFRRGAFDVLLDHAVPLAAGFAFAGPFGRHRPAGLANILAGAFGHGRIRFMNG